MNALDNVAIGMTAEKTVTVTSEMTVGHFVANMPQVYATPMMILLMEMASGSAIDSYLPEGFVSVGMDVSSSPRRNAGRPHGPCHFSRHRDRSQERCVRGRGLDGNRKIGDGTHRRGIVNVREFERRFGAKQLAMSLD
jgi:fluoroacetyl-CoA thioesterase